MSEQSKAIGFEIATVENAGRWKQTLVIMKRHPRNPRVISGREIFKHLRGRTARPLADGKRDSHRVVDLTLLKVACDVENLDKAFGQLEELRSKGADIISYRKSWMASEHALTRITYGCILGTSLWIVILALSGAILQRIINAVGMNYSSLVRPLLHCSGNTYLNLGFLVSDLWFCHLLFGFGRGLDKTTAEQIKCALRK
jgi:hypothetical protein